jgi:uroporphyrin-III C-methyltransferase
METETENFKRRIKWVAQVSEYWPISQLARMSEADMREVLSGEGASRSDPSPLSDASQGVVGTLSQHSLDIPRPGAGRIFLVGSGPGHPSLLTLATHTALTKLADLVLSDKLVPDAVLKLIPSHVPVHIAKKFPGNAEGAQSEMMYAAVEAARRGLTVVRVSQFLSILPSLPHLVQLKQGDPAVYGRFGEEVLYFRARGYEPLVVPGVSSAIAGPTLAGVPVTQRGVAESFVVCTGVGRGGKDVGLPSYVRGRTVLVLMGVARLPQVVGTLLGGSRASEGENDNGGDKGKRDGLAYPPYTPIAIIERASMPDQRVVESTLSDVGQAMESVGEQRPPGMMVIGWAVLALWGAGDVSVLEECDDMGQVTEERDRERVKRWLGGDRWRIREGLGRAWESF